MMRPLRNTVMVGDALKQMAVVADQSIDVVLTSPPYFQLRNYDAAGQLGAERTVHDWINGVRAVAGEVARVLVPTGSFWLNLGDSYSALERQGAPRKSLLLGPERLAVALSADGWIVRNKIVWAKPNPMPHPVHDRLTATWEVVYLLTRSPEYFFDLDAIRQPHRSQPTRSTVAASQQRVVETWRGPNATGRGGLAAVKAAGRVGHPLGKNPGDVWTIAPSAYPGHHATFPIALAKRVIQAACPETRCRSCRRPWRRDLIRTRVAVPQRGLLRPTCTCGRSTEPGLVLDPFFGAGTTAVAAESLGRDWLGIELSPAYAALAERRIQAARGSPPSRSAA